MFITTRNIVDTLNCQVIDMDMQVVCQPVDEHEFSPSFMETDG